MKKFIAFFGLFTILALGHAQQTSYAQAIAATAMKVWPDSLSLVPGEPGKRSCERAVILEGIESIWQATGDGKWFNYIKKSMDRYVQDDGTVKGYNADEYEANCLSNGKSLLLLYEVTRQEKYKRAVENLYVQGKTHSRTQERGFWKNNVYPDQVESLYVNQPFYAGYAKLMGDSKAFDTIMRQFTLVERGMKDPKKGFFYQGRVERLEQTWASKKSSLPPQTQAIALGWYGMALVDVLDDFPPSHLGRDSIIQILNRFAKAVSRMQDGKTGLWYDVSNIPSETQNDTEASASAMLVYTLAKGVRKGYLSSMYLNNAKKVYESILNRFVKTANKQLSLHGTVGVSGPGAVNDPKAMGAFILAANEMELLPARSEGKGKLVLLDNYFNHEFRKGANGAMEPFHYTWEEKDNDGFSTLRQVIESQGAKTGTLAAAPTKQNLKGAAVYIIVDPDDQKETTSPNIISESDAAIISDWVRTGGVLVLLGNDSAHNNLRSMNVLSTKFGIRMNEDIFNRVEGDKFEQGAVDVTGSSEIFSTAKKIYAKDITTLAVSPPAKAVTTKEGKNIIAISRYGRGTVFAIGDPWLYNEYTDGRKLPADFDNFKAAQDLVKWLLVQAKRK